ncbi:MAG: hypothetical protein WBW94_00655 [Anaerolineales bacterium]
MSRITLSLESVEKDALVVLAEKEFRNPRQQAALIIRQELERRGLLVIQTEPSRKVSKIPVIPNATTVLADVTCSILLIKQIINLISTLLGHQPPTVP